MKQATKSYLSFTRMERLGIVCLCAIIIVLIGVRVTMVYWVHPAKNVAEEQKLRAAWEVYERSQPKVLPDSVVNNQAEYVDRSEDTDTPLPNIININTADSATIVRLRGIGPVMAHKIMAHRQAHGPFKKVDELLDVQMIPKATFDLLKKHLSVD